MNLQSTRCRLHRHREAAARCPGCGGYFCRECITEIEGKVLCAACFAKRAESGRSRGSLLPVLGSLALALAGVVLLWGLFYYLGQSLLLFPADFHQGTFWKKL